MDNEKNMQTNDTHREKEMWAYMLQAYIATAVAVNMYVQMILQKKIQNKPNWFFSVCYCDPKDTVGPVPSPQWAVQIGCPFCHIFFTHLFFFNLSAENGHTRSLPRE